MIKSDVDRPHIFIVDDDAGARETTEMLLLPEGYKMSFAASGVEALARLTEWQPDVILLDVMMPGLDGFTVCQQIKASNAWRHIPVILVTALDGQENLARGLEAGADDFVSKPINKLELRARVRSMLRIKQRHDELERVIRLREDLTRMLMHDIRTPLTALLIYCDLLAREPLTEKQGHFLTTIQGQATRLSSFLTDMLLMAKIEQGKLILNLVWVDVRELVAAAYRTYLPLAEARNLNLALLLPNDPVHLHLDANLWQRLLDNLLTNAFKYSPVDGTVTINLIPLSDNGISPSFRLQIIDEGPGIPPEQWQTIFDRFEIVAHDQRGTDQIGLGLAFCKMVLDAHRGRIYISANRPQGAILNVEM